MQLKELGENSTEVIEGGETMDQEESKCSIERLKKRNAIFSICYSLSEIPVRPDKSLTLLLGKDNGAKKCRILIIKNIAKKTNSNLETLSLFSIFELFFRL